MMTEKGTAQKQALKQRIAQSALITNQKDGNLQKTERPTWNTFLKSKKDEIAAVLPSIINRSGGVERMIRLALTVVKRKPALLECTPESVLGSLIECSSLGLEPETPLKQGHLVPFNNKNTGKKECTLIVDYRGYIDLAYRSGAILSIRANVVYKQDRFDYSYGLNETLNHVPANVGNLKDSDITHAYAYAKMRDGAFTFMVFPVEKIIDHRNRFSKAWDPKKPESSPWGTDFPKMAMKTMVRQLVDFLPRSAENQLLSRANSSDENTTNDPFNFNFEDSFEENKNDEGVVNKRDITEDSQVS